MKMNAKQIANIIGHGQGFWGLRALCDDEQYVVGDEPRESYDWDHENDISTYKTTRATVGGVSTVGISIDWEDEIEQNIEAALRKVRDYGKTLALIHADHMDFGEDDGEAILHGNFCVMAVWEAE